LRRMLLPDELPVCETGTRLACGEAWWGREWSAIVLVS
jgi:hypothetical protein